MSYNTYTIESTDSTKSVTYGEIDNDLFTSIINAIKNHATVMAATSNYLKVDNSSGIFTVNPKNFSNEGMTCRIAWNMRININTRTFSYIRSRVSSSITDAEVNFVVNFYDSVYQMALRLQRSSPKATNIAEKFGIEYDLWTTKQSITFKNGQVLFPGNARDTSNLSYGSQRYRGAEGILAQPGYRPPGSGLIWSNTDTARNMPKFSGIYLVKSDSPEESIRMTQRGKAFYILLIPQYSWTSSDVVLQPGFQLTINKYDMDNQSVVYESTYFFATTANVSNYDVKEMFEDTDNTYPGGGEDKNDYPDEGSEELGGESGKGDFDNTNDQIDFPTLPTFDVQSTGFISLWKPTIVQLTELYSFLWDSDISTTLKKLFNEPMNAIFSLGIVPVDPVTQGTRRLTIGHVDTEIDMESIQKQFATFDFGSIDINEYYGAAWDYSPYTHASIYLPYIGVQPVDIDDIMNCTLTLRYNIDILTGTTIALLKCTRKGRDNLDAVMYEWQGNCVTHCPITAGNWSEIMSSVITLGAMTGLALTQPIVGSIGSAIGSSAAAEYAQGKNLVNPTMAMYGALNVLGSKVHVQRGGRLDMSAGAMSMQKAFVILNRPVSGIPRGWNKFAGYPSLKIKTLGSQEGFVSVGAIKLDGLKATSAEISELDTILKSGVII